MLRFIKVLKKNNLGERNVGICYSMKHNDSTEILVLEQNSKTDAKFLENDINLNDTFMGLGILNMMCKNENSNYK